MCIYCHSNVVWTSGEARRNAYLQNKNKKKRQTESLFTKERGRQNAYVQMDTPRQRGARSPYLRVVCVCVCVCAPCFQYLPIFVCTLQLRRTSQRATFRFQAATFPPATTVFTTTTPVFTTTLSLLLRHYYSVFTTTHTHQNSGSSNVLLRQRVRR